MKLSVRLRTLRKAAGLSQLEAARTAGIDPSMWCSFETDRPSCRNPRLVTLNALARGIGVPMATLLDGVVVHDPKHDQVGH